MNAQFKTFVWNKDFETGLSAVDDQHRHLVNLINELGDQILNQKISETDYVRLFANLTDYTHYNFDTAPA